MGVTLLVVTWEDDMTEPEHDNRNTCTRGIWRSSLALHPRSSVRQGALLVAVYTNNDNDFMGVELGKVRVYKFLNNKSMLLKLLPPTEDAFIQHLRRAALATVLDKTAHNSKPITSNHVKTMGGLWMMASSYQCHPHNQPGHSNDKDNILWVQ